MCEIVLIGALASDRSFDLTGLTNTMSGAWTSRSRTFTGTSLPANPDASTGESGRRFWAARRLPREQTITGVDISRAATELLQV